MTCDEAIEESWREHWPRLLALLAARFQRVDVAEDALAEAFAAAARRWPVDGVPDSPVAWLHRVAQREVVDRLRSEASAHRAAARIADGLALRADPTEPRLEAVPDDLLRLVFLACHPALPPHAQTALALRWVLGVPTAEIARLFAVTPAAMSARLTRARQRAAAEPHAFELPTGSALDDRVEGVLRTAHLLFTSGYAPSDGDEVVRPALCAEAIRLVAVVDDLVPRRTDVRALRSLLELQHARRDARTDGRGELVLLANQDRRRWRHEEIATAMGRLLVLDPATGFAEELRLQGLIAAVHAVAASPDATDWPLALTFYDRLLALSGDDPVVRLNRAVVVAHVRGAGRALVELGPVDPRDHRTAGTLAELHAQADRHDAAAALFASAAAWCACDPVRRHYLRRAAELQTRP